MSEKVFPDYREQAKPLPAHPQDTDHSGLFIIGILKLAKSLFFFLLGIGAFHMVHKDLGNEAMHLATVLRFDPEGHVMNYLLLKVDLIDTHHLREIGFATFAYSALALVEGIGLLRQKTWAEYLTLGLTISFLPWELYELGRDPSWMRWLLLATNLAVLAYLVWLLRRIKQLMHQGRQSASGEVHNAEG
jgi:uncharacterized membrane protein (DUF2068 family)